MELGASYHNHSTWSDGEADMEAMIVAARAAGLKVFGLSDHFVPHPTLGVVDWSMPRERLEDYVECLGRYKRRYDTDEFKVLAGIEVDYFPENCQTVASMLRGLGLDYIIGSVHYVDEFPIDNSAEDWESLDGDGARDRVFHGYWQRELGLCQSGLYDIVGHLDLPKKYGYHAGYDVTEEVEAALRALKASGMRMELNTAGWDKVCEEAYPSEGILRRAASLGIPMVLSTDAHAVEHVARHLDAGVRLLRRCGCLE